MPDPDLTSSICDGETSTVQIGVDQTSLDPNRRLAVVKRDNRTIVNDDAIPAGTNNGDLPGGIKVSICGENAEIPFAARAQDADSGNLLRMQQDGAGNDCGLVVQAPQIAALNGGPAVRVLIPQNVDGANPAGVVGATSATVTLTNTDSVDKLFTVSCRVSTIVEIGAADGVSEMQVAAESVINVGTFTDGSSIHSRVVCLTYGAGDFDGRTMNDQRDVTDMVIVPPGATRVITYRPRTIRNINTIAPGGASQRGMIFTDFTRRSEQVRTS